MIDVDFKKEVETIREQIEDHLQSINENTDEIENNYSYLVDTDQRLKALENKVGAIYDMLAKLTKTDVKKSKNQIKLSARRRRRDRGRSAAPRRRRTGGPGGRRAPASRPRPASTCSASRLVSIALGRTVDVVAPQIHGVAVGPQTGGPLRVLGQTGLESPRGGLVEHPVDPAGFLPRPALIAFVRGHGCAPFSSSPVSATSSARRRLRARNRRDSTVPRLRPRTSAMPSYGSPSSSRSARTVR